MSSSAGAGRRMGVLRGWLGGRVDDQMARRVAVALLALVVARSVRFSKRIGRAQTARQDCETKNEKPAKRSAGAGFLCVAWVLLGNLMVPRAGIEPARL